MAVEKGITLAVAAGLLGRKVRIGQAWSAYAPITYTDMDVSSLEWDGGTFLLWGTLLPREKAPYSWSIDIAEVYTVQVLDR